MNIMALIFGFKVHRVLNLHNKDFKIQVYISIKILHIMVKQAVIFQYFSEMVVIIEIFKNSLIMVPFVA